MIGQPNILLLHTDQQRFDTIAALGATHVDTPNLDRLVRMGTAFTSAYSSNPICVPARHDLITGAGPRAHGYFTNQNTPISDYRLSTLPRLLTQAGYRTTAVGKMHFWPEREHHGFERMFLMEELPSCREHDAYVQYLESMGHGDVMCQHGVRPLFYHSPQPARVPEEHHGSAWVATKTIEVINEARSEPFFIFASWVGPHPPFYVPQQYLDRYRGRSLPEPTPLPEWANNIDAHTGDAKPDCLAVIREAYFAAITLIDHHIGRILDDLERTGKLDNTLILFTSDHGEMLGDRGGFQKMVPYDGAARIPMIVAGPGVATGVCVTPVTTWDTAATVVEAAGLGFPDGHPSVGTSLRSIAADPPEGRIVVSQHGFGAGRWIMATDGTLKFIHWYNGDEEAYDLAHDPTEQINIAADIDVSELRSSCIAFERQHGSTDAVQDDCFVDDLTGTPHPQSHSLFPDWSSQQFPPWAISQVSNATELIVSEMNACKKARGAFVGNDPVWKQRAYECWESIHGERARYDELFQTYEKGSDQAPDCSPS
jgi:arylsulfatase A-like enzyme